MLARQIKILCILKYILLCLTVLKICLPFHKIDIIVAKRLLVEFEAHVLQDFFTACFRIYVNTRIF